MSGYYGGYYREPIISYDDVMEVDEDTVDASRGKGNSAFASPNISEIGSSPPVQDPPVEHDLYVRLEDIARGCIKKMKVSRRVMDRDGKMRQAVKILTVKVQPGWKAGTKITFPQEGDHIPNHIPADISFIIRDKPHPIFKREGNDIQYTATVSLKEALCGTSVLAIPTLSGEKKTLEITEIINPHFVHRFKNEGLPLPKTPTRKGDLIVNFDIKFPVHLPDSSKNVLKVLLSN